MAPTAYVLVTAEAGSEEDVSKSLKEIDGVEEVKGVYGVFDLVAKVHGETMDELNNTITKDIRRLDKVKSSLTQVVVKGFKRDERGNIRDYKS